MTVHTVQFRSVFSCCITFVLYNICRAIVYERMTDFVFFFSNTMIVFRYHLDSINYFSEITPISQLYTIDRFEGRKFKSDRIDIFR